MLQLAKDFLAKHSWNNLTGRRKSFIIATIVVLAVFFFWLNFTSVGYLAQTSMYKTFNHDPRVVTVYSTDGEVLRRFTGRYSVEYYNHHYSIINHDNGERTDIYGSATVLIDEEDESAEQG